MPLTAFGKACRQHRIRMNAVMADQSNATGFPTSLISQIETGAVGLPEDYMNKLVEWMQLEDLESHQLKLLARLRSKRMQKQYGPNEGHDLIRILNQLAIKK